MLFLIIFWSPLEGKNNDKGLNVNLNKFKNPEEIVIHCCYILRLIKNEKTKKQTNTAILTAYIEYHNKNCINPYCPLKKINKIQ